MSRWTIVGGAALLAAGVMGAWQGQAQPTTATATALTAVEGAACDVDDAPARATRRRPRGDAETRRALIAASPVAGNTIQGVPAKARGLCT